MALEITTEYKSKVVEALLNQRKNFDGADEAFAKQYKINPGVYNQIKNGKKLDGLLRDAKWMEVGRLLNVSTRNNHWKIVKTEPLRMLTEEVAFCQKHSTAKVWVDDTSIGKSECARYLSRTRKNCFYVDGSQAKTKQAFVRLIAQTVGVDSIGRYIDVKETLKYYLNNMIDRPMIIIDESGDIEYTAFLELKELWNATEGYCGWYMMGADGLREKMSRGIRGKKVGYREMFARYGEKFTTIVPTDKQEKLQWYKNLMIAVAQANLNDVSKMNEIIKKCLHYDEHGNISGLRRLKNLILIMNEGK